MHTTDYALTTIKNVEGRAFCQKYVDVQDRNISCATKDVMIVIMINFYRILKFNI